MHRSLVVERQHLQARNKKVKLSQILGTMGRFLGAKVKLSERNPIGICIGGRVSWVKRSADPTPASLTVR
jgi:hypothetical protein